MKKRGRLQLTAQQMAFTLALCRELNRLGIAIEYGAFIIAVANWWIGNAEQRIPEDNQRLAHCLTQAIAAWMRKAKAPDDLPGFLIMQMKIFAAQQPHSYAPHRAGRDARIADVLQAWDRRDTAHTEMEVE